MLNRTISSFDALIFSWSSVKYSISFQFHYYTVLPSRVVPGRKYFKCTSWSLLLKSAFNHQLIPHLKRETQSWFFLIVEYSAWLCFFLQHTVYSIFCFRYFNVCPLLCTFYALHSPPTISIVQTNPVPNKPASSDHYSYPQTSTFSHYL